mmetsp:Transcript_5391/g.14864  ORF Transcript_5391/g.14864 Transcript_5391/m.14864 type:complete len:287 (-) Transcript_5391:1685-2545(-)
MCPLRLTRHRSSVTVMAITVMPMPTVTCVTTLTRGLAFGRVCVLGLRVESTPTHWQAARPPPPARQPAASPHCPTPPTTSPPPALLLHLLHRLDNTSSNRGAEGDGRAASSTWPSATIACRCVCSRRGWRSGSGRRSAGRRSRPSGGTSSSTRRSSSPAGPTGAPLQPTFGSHSPKSQHSRGLAMGFSVRQVRPSGRRCLSSGCCRQWRSSASSATPRGDPPCPILPQRQTYSCGPGRAPSLRTPRRRREARTPTLCAVTGRRWAWPTAWAACGNMASIPGISRRT